MEKMQLLVTPGLILAYSPEHRQVMITIMKPHTASSHLQYCKYIAHYAVAVRST